MIDLYTWNTDNGHKARHGLEESGLEFTVKPVALPKRENFEPEFLKISPNHKIPAMIDDDGPGGNSISIFESGAILKYVAEKAGSDLYPTDAAQRVNVDQWLFYGSATFTTLAQQYGAFHYRMPNDVPAAKEHYQNVLKDLLETVDRHLGDNEYLAGGYSVADISVYADTHIYADKDFGFDNFPNVKRWHDAIAARPAVERAWVPLEV